MGYRSVGRWIWNAGAFLFFVGLAGSALMVGCMELTASALCDRTPVHQSASPDGRKIARLGVSDCGGTTNWQSGLTIEDTASGKTFGGLWLMDGKPEGVTLQWQNAHTLVISGFDLKKVLAFRQDNFSGVKVVLAP